MWFLFLLLSCFSVAFDDVFTDIPSQFNGLNVFAGGSFDTQIGQAKFNTILFQGPSEPRLNVEVMQQQNQDLWVNTKFAFVSLSVKDHIVYENNSASRVTVSYPLRFGVGYKKGFLFNPSTLASAHLGVGMERANYSYTTYSDTGHHLFFKAGVDLALAVLTQWGVSMGLDVAVSEEKDVLLNVTNKYHPPNIRASGQIGVIFFHGGDDFGDQDDFYDTQEEDLMLSDKTEQRKGTLECLECDQDYN